MTHFIFLLLLVTIRPYSKQTEGYTGLSKQCRMPPMATTSKKTVKGILSITMTLKALGINQLIKLTTIQTEAFSKLLLLFLTQYFSSLFI